MLTTDEIIRRCVQTHKNIYDYSKVEYKGDKHKIEIICPKHGSFFQNAYFHYGKLKCKCPKCVGRNLSNYEIIKELTELNGYNYSLIDEKIDFKKIYYYNYKRFPAENYILINNQDLYTNFV